MNEAAIIFAVAAEQQRGRTIKIRNELEDYSQYIKPLAAAALWQWKRNKQKQQQKQQ